MTDQEKLNKARELYDKGEYAEARKLLEATTTRDPAIRLNILLAMLGVLNHVTENYKLLAVVEEGMKITSKTGNEAVGSFLLGQKCNLLLSNLSMLIYRQKNLKLSANVFEWIGFSLERDEKEYKKISEQRIELENEIKTMLAIVIERAERGVDHEFRGHQFYSIGDAYSSKYLIDKLDFQNGGRIRAKIANMYFVRRWNLDRYLYKKDDRKTIDQSRDKCIKYFIRSIKEFELAGMKSQQAHIIYNLATKLLLFNHFRQAKKLLAEAKVMAHSVNEKRLLDKIKNLEDRVADKNRNIPDYVSEMGLDLP